jgi:hypothetical protein
MQSHRPAPTPDQEVPRTLYAMSMAGTMALDAELARCRDMFARVIGRGEKSSDSLKQHARWLVWLREDVLSLWKDTTPQPGIYTAKRT